jgi:hypothetical protein
MRLLAREVACSIVGSYGPNQLLERLADPFWFQAFGCVLGFDWHSSGLTTTTLAALKEGIRGLEGELGFFLCGGKGRASRQTPLEIEEHAARHGLPQGAQGLIYASRMAAKVDSNAVQDGYQIYHHCFAFTREGRWAVIQQGMNEAARYARRYHWLSDALSSFVSDPHLAVCCDARGPALNLVAREAGENRAASVELARQAPRTLERELSRLRELDLPARHQVLLADVRPENLHRILVRTYEAQAADYEQLLGLPGVGGRTLRALALLAEVIHARPASLRDPARFSFAHGGKDGHPYPVDREVYDRSIQVLRQALDEARVGRSERVEALRRLARFQARS